MRVSDFPELPAFLFTDQPWAEQALCAQVDPELFYPEKGGVKTATKAICTACPVTAECLAWAMETDEEHGIWGGMTAKERKVAKRTGEAAA